MGLPHLVACLLSQSTLLGSRLLCWELSEAGPELYALPWSKLLRFRFLGTPQRLRLGWACVLCFSWVRAAQVTRCLASAVAPRWGCVLSPPLSLWPGFLGVQLVCRVSLLGSWSLAATLLADVDHPESQEACLQFGSGCLSGAATAPFCLWLPLPACLWLGMSWLCSDLCSVSGPGCVSG